MSLVIRKKGVKNFFHYFTIDGTEFVYSASDLVIIFENTKAKLRSLTGRPIALKDGYLVNQITIFDDTTSGSAETFANFIQLQTRLIALGYPAYYQDGEIVLGELISQDAGNILVLGDDGKLYVPASGGSSAVWGDITGQLTNQTDLIDYLNNLIGIGSGGNALINGFYTNIPDSYQYFVWSDAYIINGTLYQGYISDIVTLSAADVTNNRFDVIVINSNGTISVVEGTAAVNPTVPIIDSETQLAVTTILVTANTTAPVGVTTDLVYDENAQVAGGEWNTVASAGSINLASAEQAENGTVSIKFTSASSGANVLFTDTTNHIGNNLSVFRFGVYLPSSSNYRFSVKITDIDGNTATGTNIQNGDYGFNNSLVNQWQVITIPSSAFAGIAGITYDTVQFSNERNNSTFFVDLIQIQEGLTPVVTDLPDYTLNIVGSELQLLKDGLIHSIVDFNNLPIDGGTL